jgi:DTW domain-containing protein
MARSVVHNPTLRCIRCEHVPRWCVCEGLRTVECPLAVDVLMHSREVHRPSSTGHLIQRVLEGTRTHVYRHDAVPAREQILRPDKELWVLHPLGEPMPAAARPENLQVLLLDGSWGEAADMKKAVEGWGRRVSLPMTGKSRYLLRAQQGPGQFSTMEALLFLLEALGLKTECAALRVQMELHVYAGLRTRGQSLAAADYLATSPLRTVMPEVIARMNPQSPEERSAFSARLKELTANARVHGPSDQG